MKHILTLLCILPLLAPLARLRAAESDTLDLDKRTSQGIPFRHNKPSLLPFPAGIEHVRVERSDSDQYNLCGGAPWVMYARQTMCLSGCFGPTSLATSLTNWKK